MYVYSIKKATQCWTCRSLSAALPSGVSATLRNSVAPRNASQRLATRLQHAPRGLDTLNGRSATRRPENEKNTMQCTEGIVLDRCMRLRQRVHSNQQAALVHSNNQKPIWPFTFPFTITRALTLTQCPMSTTPPECCTTTRHTMLEMPCRYASQRDQRNASQSCGASQNCGASQRLATPRNASQRACNTHLAHSVRSTAGARLDGRRKPIIMKCNAPKASC